MNKNVPSATIQHNDATTQGDEPMKFYPYGHDFGNSEIGGVLIKGKEVLSRSIPTAFTKVDPSAMRNLGVDMDSALIIQHLRKRPTRGMGGVISTDMHRAIACVACLRYPVLSFLIRSTGYSWSLVYQRRRIKGIQGYGRTLKRRWKAPILLRLMVERPCAPCI